MPRLRMMLQSHAETPQDCGVGHVTCYFRYLCPPYTTVASFMSNVGDNALCTRCCVCVSVVRVVEFVYQLVKVSQSKRHHIDRLALVTQKPLAEVLVPLQLTHSAFVLLLLCYNVPHNSRTRR